MSDRRSGPVFKAGRDQHIAYAEQGDATLNANVSNNDGSTDVAILAELQAVREMLARMSAPGSASTALLEAAEKAAEGPEPRRDEVIGYVQAATKLAAGAAGFAEQADRLIPRLQQIAAWAGRTWDGWRPVLGL